MRLQHLMAGLLSAGVLCGTLAAEPAGKASAKTVQKKPSIFKHYLDWKFQPVTTSDPNAGENVRNQMDFTVPIHGPWLTNPSDTGMTITWITRIRCAGGIEYKEKDTKTWTRLWPTRYGQVDYSRDVQSFHLTGLKPDTVYEYRLLSNLDSINTAYHMVVCTARETYTFRTLNPDQKTCKVFVTSQFSGSARLTLDPLIERTDTRNADAYFFLGNNTEYNVGFKLRYLTTLGFLDDITWKWGKSKPTVFLRGERELIGGDSYTLYGEYFPTPNGKTYQTISIGPVLFICLDTMRDPEEAVQKEQYEKYLKEQAEWLRGLKDSPAWERASFRVVLGYFAPINLSAQSKNVLAEFNDVLNSAGPSGLFGDMFGRKNRNIHLYLAGNEGMYFRVNPDAKELITGNKACNDAVPKLNKFGAQVIKALPEQKQYTLVNCHPLEGMTLEATAEKLTVRSYRWDKIEGGVHDEFTILPDGSVTTGIKEPAVYPEQKQEGRK